MRSSDQLLRGFLPDCVCVCVCGVCVCGCGVCLCVCGVCLCVCVFVSVFLWSKDLKNAVSVTVAVSETHLNLLLLLAQCFLVRQLTAF